MSYNAVCQKCGNRKRMDEFAFCDDCSRKTINKLIGTELKLEEQPNNNEIQMDCKELQEPLRTGSGTLNDPEIFQNTSGKYDIDVSLD
jgi:hypothetical protein